VITIFNNSFSKKIEEFLPKNKYYTATCDHCMLKIVRAEDIFSVNIHADQGCPLSHRGLWPSNFGRVSLLMYSEFKSQRARLSSSRCLTCLLGLQGVQWVWGLVVVLVSWTGHPRLYIYKKDALYHQIYIYKHVRLMRRIV
jgi:hypothetical protein